MTNHKAQLTWLSPIYRIQIQYICFNVKKYYPHYIQTIIRGHWCKKRQANSVLEHEKENHLNSKFQSLVTNRIIIYAFPSFSSCQKRLLYSCLFFISSTLCVRTNEMRCYCYVDSRFHIFLPHATLTFLVLFSISLLLSYVYTIIWNIDPEV